MTTEFAGDRRRRRIIILIALVLAVVAAIGVYSLTTRPGGTGPVATPVAVTVVTAAVEIEARTQITSEMLTTLSVPDSPAMQFAVTDPETVIGQTAVVDIPVGQVLQTNFVGTGNPVGVTILAPGETVAPDSPVWRAVSVQLSRDRAVGGLVSPGDHVDLIGTIELTIVGPDGLPPSPIPGDFQTGNSTKITLLDVEILNADVDTNLYVVKVDENQAEQVAHIQAEDGSFTFALRPPADARDLDRNLYGVTTDRITVEYNFPVPQVLVVPFGASPPPRTFAPPTLAPASPSPSPSPSPTP